MSCTSNHAFRNPLYQERGLGGLVGVTTSKESAAPPVTQTSLADSWRRSNTQVLHLLMQLISLTQPPRRAPGKVAPLASPWLAHEDGVHEGSQRSSLNHGLASPPACFGQRWGGMGSPLDDGFASPPACVGQWSHAFGPPGAFPQAAFEVGCSGEQYHLPITKVTAPSQAESASTQWAGGNVSDNASSATDDEAAPACHTNRCPQHVTLKIRHIPIAYTLDMLLEELPNDGSYDFVYLPMNAKGVHNLTYAFVNFVSEEAAARFASAWHKRRLARFENKKPLHVSAADLQGFEELVASLKKLPSRRLQTRKCQPYIVKHGRVVSLNEVA